MMTLSRRRLMQLLAGATVPLRGADRAKRDMIVRSAGPEDFEAPLSAFDSWITPVEHFFVRSHMSRPTVDLASWRLSVTGLVSQPLTLSMEDLRKLPTVEVVSVLECAGNGRSFFEPSVIGMQWKYGAVGNGRWRGVRLADVLKWAALKSSATQILFNGADTPPRTMPDFARTIPVRKALGPETLLAFDMNGEPLPMSHGFPLRVIAPGWAGDSWVKWVTNIEALDKEYDGFFMKTAYRYPVRPIAPGAAVDAADLKPVEALRPKSVIAGPVEGANLGLGPVRIHGAAWAGESPVTRVDVSTDSGRTWRAATLGSDRARYAWRLWQMNWTPAGPGSYVLMARATDETGGTQPIVADWNPSGYFWNAPHQVRVEVGTQVSAAPAATPPEAPAFPPKVRQACNVCHGSDIISGQRLTRAQWDRELNKMTGWGAMINPSDRGEILDFLVRYFGPR